MSNARHLYPLASDYSYNHAIAQVFLDEKAISGISSLEKVPACSF